MYTIARWLSLHECAALAGFVDELHRAAWELIHGRYCNDGPVLIPHRCQLACSHDVGIGCGLGVCALLEDCCFVAQLV